MFGSVSLWTPTMCCASVWVLTVFTSITLSVVDASIFDEVCCFTSRAVHRDACNRLIVSRIQKYNAYDKKSMKKSSNILLDYIAQICYYFFN